MTPESYIKKLSLGFAATFLLAFAVILLSNSKSTPPGANPKTPTKPTINPTTQVITQVATTGDLVSISYTGALESGEVFDTSVGKPNLEFTIGGSKVIPGFEKGVMGMAIGERKNLVIPPNEAYGENGIEGVIPPNSTLVFDVELHKITKPFKKILKDITNNELKQLLKEGIVAIDIRRPNEWKDTGVIKGTKLLTLYNENNRQNPNFMKDFSKIIKDKNTPFILICRTGSRTKFASQAFANSLGYNKVYNLKRGITNWISTGNPVIEK